jgi:hypothetical protein
MLLSAASTPDRLLRALFTVMAGLVPAIHAVRRALGVALERRRSGVDGRDKPGHDGNGASANLIPAPFRARLRTAAKASRGAA